MENIPVNAQPPLSRARVCAMYLRGACPNGDLCNYSHPPLSPESPTSPRTLVSPQSTGRLSAAQETFPLDVAFASFLPRHAQTLPSPITPQRHSHHAFSLPLYSSASRSPNNSLDIPITPTMTSSFSSATSSSVSASPTSSLMASPPEAFYNRRYSETHDEEVEAVLGGRGMKYGAIGTGIPSYTNEPVSLVHEIYTYDDDDDDEVIVYMRESSIPRLPCFFRSTSC
ncbi:hypothetical protein DL93DRAFT_1127670 [Clavulina sp. PMI_390]|nr:hypothetical protein DL93DRAFT_1127670 [Clavulina sp. PMI_390]